MDTVKKILEFLMTATAIAAVLFIVSNTYGIVISEFTSFPWWSALVLGLYYFGPALILEWLVLLGIRYFEKKRNQD